MTPWTRRQDGAALALAAVGVLALGWSWWGASGQTTLASQHGWIALGAGGTATVGAAAVAWLALGRRAVRTRVAALVATVPLPAPSHPVAAAVVAGPGMRHHHRSTCQLAAGKDLAPAPAGLRPCPMCRP